MELRHLRYFVAVAEEGSLTNAAERRLHTAQPSLSRQIRDLELEIGVKLLDAQKTVVAKTGEWFSRLDVAQNQVASPGAIHRIGLASLSAGDPYRWRAVPPRWVALINDREQNGGGELLATM